MKRLTEKFGENAYSTSDVIIKELEIDESNEDDDYIKEQQKNIIATLDNKLGELEDFIEEIDNATIIYKDSIATFHIDMVLNNKILDIVKKHFNYKEIKR